MRQFLAFVLSALPALAQPSLTLQDAVRTAVRQHAATQAGAAQIRAADARIAQAHGGYLPRVTYSESFARSDNPVFVFSSLLTQRQFTEANFAPTTLNRPDFLNNFQSTVSIDQTVFNAGATRARVRSAALGVDMSKQSLRRTELDLTARVVRAYFDAVLAGVSLETSRSAVQSAEADLARATTIRTAGMSTDADVLSLRVHLAGVRESAIRRKYDLEIAMAAINEALGEPLDTPHLLATPLTAANIDGAGPTALNKMAVSGRPELTQTGLASELAKQQRVIARSALLPQIDVRGVFEADRQRFVNRSGANWLLSGSLRWNLFDGNASRARVREADAVIEAAKYQQTQVASAIALELQRAMADFRSAEERITVAAAAVTQAEESLRIVKNRYEAGLTTVTELLRTETALLDTRTRRLTAIHDQRIAAAFLELAAGTLTAESEVLK